MASMTHDRIVEVEQVDRVADWRCEWCKCSSYAEVPDRADQVRCINCKRLNVKPGYELPFALELAATRLSAAAVNAISDPERYAEYSQWAAEARAALSTAPQHGELVEEPK
jgi:hypothetical protein